MNGHFSAHRRGFTLIELLVAVGLFSIIIAVAVGGFVRALKTQRELSSLLSAESNVSLAIEQMSREIRTGLNFCPIGRSGQSLCDCPIIDSQNDTKTCNNIAFVNASNETVVYNLQNGVLEKSEDGGVTFNPVTGTNVTIPYLETVIYGSTIGDHWPPRVTVMIGVTPNDSDLAAQALNLQTTISVRNIDCDASGHC